jgi:hypothetical protein
VIEIHMGILDPSNEALVSKPRDEFGRDANPIAFGQMLCARPLGISEVVDYTVNGAHSSVRSERDMGVQFSLDQDHADLAPLRWN